MIYDVKMTPSSKSPVRNHQHPPNPTFFFSSQIILDLDKNFRISNAIETNLPSQEPSISSKTPGGNGYKTNLYWARKLELSIFNLPQTFRMIPLAPTNIISGILVFSQE